MRREIDTALGVGRKVGLGLDDPRGKVFVNE
jgi:hypothetical protein